MTIRRKGTQIPAGSKQRRLLRRLWGDMEVVDAKTDITLDHRLKVEKVRRERDKAVGRRQNKVPSRKARMNKNDLIEISLSDRPSQGVNFARYAKTEKRS